MANKNSNRRFNLDNFGSLISKAAHEFEFQEEIKENKKERFIASDAPIIKLVDTLIFKAIQEGISDIHIEPFEDSIKVRYRIDGVMYKYSTLPIVIKNAVVSRIKIMANMDITEKRLPLDGRIKVNFKNKKDVDLRVSTVPTLFGESVVLRILDKESFNNTLEEIICDKAVLNTVTKSISKPYGLILVTGPTGSGKTTTIYSMLKKLNKDSVKILTAENPVEFYFKGINQVNINREIGLDFSNVLRSFLRQDPDIMMVGEIRDLETAQIAIRAAMTGHLVFSTLHTNDSASTIFRLIDIGVPKYLLAGSLNMILSQRLIRTFCPHCKTIKNNDDENKTVEAVGCDKCHNLGYSGRIAIYEVMRINNNLRNAINQDYKEDEIRKIAIENGMTSLREAGIKQVKKGLSSYEEVFRNTENRES